MRLAAFVLVLSTALFARAAERHAMAVYHFNLQYVAGGVKGFPTGDSSDPQFDLDERQTEDAIIVESFDPLLDVYLRHPAWGCDVELQGYMIDVLRARHPAVLAKLKTLADRGQISVDSFHWSDQLWVAYPRRDQEVSFELAKKSFAAAALPLGTAVWTQEGQFAPGQTRFMKERGLEVAVVPRNLFKWLRGDAADKPLYRCGEVLCVVTTGTQDDFVETAWTFVDDGELAVTGGGNPYLGVHFRKKDEELKKFEDNLAAMETAGWKHSTVAQFAQRAAALGSVPAELPPLLDGTWQPKETGNVFRWMGGAGLLNPIGAEADNLVLTTNARVSRLVRTVDALLPTLTAEGLEIDGVPVAEVAESAWRELLLAEVSDSTGWNPFVVERDYSLTHAASAERLAQSVLQHDDVASRLAPVRDEPVLEEAAALVAMTFDGAADRAAKATWRKRAGTTVYEVSIAFAPTKAERAVSVAFPRAHDRLVTTLALEDGRVQDFALADFAPDQLAVPVPTGLVGLADDLFLVQRQESVRLAAFLPKAEKVVRFADETAPAAAFTWQFVVVKGTKEQALAEALALNVAPVFELGPPGCGCAGETPGALVLFSLLAMARRRARGRV